jgi:hypothetical protein
MNKFLKLGVGLFLLSMTGCALFQPCVPVDPSQLSLPEANVPTKVRAVQSVVFSFYGRTMTGIGAISLDRSTRSFDLSCMTPMGTKLFDLSMKNGNPEVLFALPFFAEKEGFGEAVAQDIARIYFDSEPANLSRAYSKGDLLWVESDQDYAMFAYGYAGDPLILTRKNVFEERALVAQIEYLNFLDQDGVRYLEKARLKSKLYGYELTIRTKEIKTRTRE